jgi:hypothetical protein
MTPRAVAIASLTSCKSLVARVVTHVPLTQYKTRFPITTRSKCRMQELIHRRSDMRMADQLLPTRFGSALKYGSAAAGCASSGESLAVANIAALSSR